ncbi:hypothetical protein K7W42_01485 [Deinococcus sp. HMF7604]|uniref:SWIM zinc finger family protein n=1 Tax=Deinococcus betulae TaxID=2873312 RepID=UPI001CCACA40|nr:hypothetical protein [Deinococcus betulae]MBZ9749526.1 hypothetical protein [Deinococcus betulae]
MTVFLSKQAALDHVGAQEWRKGQAYVERLTGLSAQADGPLTLLRAAAQGQERYMVWVTVAGQQVQEARCTCYVGASGHCKHVAALLARAVDDPNSFLLLPPLDEALGAMTAEGLRELVRQMLRREPDLMRLLLAQPTGQSGSGLAERFRAAFALLEYDPEQDWEGEGPDTSDLWPLADELTALSQASGTDAQELLNAANALIDGAAEKQDEEYGVELGDLAAPARAALLRLLARPLEESLRAAALEALQDSVAEFGWSEAPEQVELFAALPDEDRALTTGFLHGLMEASSLYRQRDLAAALSALSDPGSLSPDEDISLARAAGDPGRLAEVLLRHGRREEAVEALTAGPRPAAPQEVEAAFSAHDLLPELERYAQQHLRVYGARAWLYGRYHGTGRLSEAHALALDGALHGAGHHPHFTTQLLPHDLDWLATLKAVSPAWPADRETLITHWAKHPATLRRLVVFLLDERLPERALKEVQGRTQDVVKVLGPELALRLALELSAEQATPLILQAVTAHIAGRARPHYRAAAEALQAAAPLIGREEACSAARLFVQEYPKLRALKEEMQRAGLL